MNILIAGASGFIGQALVKALLPNHKITVLGREDAKLKALFQAPIAIATWDTLDCLNAKEFDAIINLSGHNIAASRWNESVKKKLIDSRVETNKALCNFAINHAAKPHFYSASAIGVYGLQKTDDSTPFDEYSKINFQQPVDFMSEIGVRWENALQPARDAGIPITITRFGVVLKRGQGMLQKLALAFNFGLGSIIGDGKQIISWVHIDDVINAYLFLLNNPQLTGCFNLSSPNPVKQEEFAKSLASAMHRPLFLKTPVFFIRALLGEMGENLILKGQRVLPKRLQECGYEFSYPSLKEALTHEFSH